MRLRVGAGGPMSLWWSFVLTVFGASGMLLAYRSYKSYTGPIVGLVIQSVWIAYGIASAQWWFIVGAFIYGGSHIYGVRKRIRERGEIVGGTMQGPTEERNCRCYQHNPREATPEAVLWSAPTEVQHD